MPEHAGLKDTVDFEAGEVILVNKPIDWTSFDVVARIRSMFGIKKVGHAGTLDPKATGLLIICTGKMTKSIDRFAAWEKEYSGVMELGAVTKSFDVETEIFDKKNVTGITSEKVSKIFESFVGKQLQVPPMYSAIKQGGKRLYKLARKGKEVHREPREIFIKEFVMTSFSLPTVQFRVVCSKGTYIRTLANDCGEKLGCGAYLKELTRTRIGNFSVEDAYEVQDLHLLGHKLHPSAVTL